MGSSTCSDIVPVVAHNIASSYQNKEFAEQLDGCDCDGRPSTMAFGIWQRGADAVEIGKRKRIYATEWSNGTYTIYVVNEAQYSNGGELVLAIVAYDDAAIHAFFAEVLKPKGINYAEFAIEMNDTVQQTL